MKMAAVRRNHWSHISTLGFVPVKPRIILPEASGATWPGGSGFVLKIWAGYSLRWSSPARKYRLEDIHSQRVGFLTRWGFELLITSIYTVGAVSMLIYGVRKRHRFLLLFPGILVVAAGIVFHNNGMMGSYTLLVIGILILAIGIYYFIQRSIPKPLNRS